MRRETLAYQGEHYTLPLPDGPGKALKLIIHPVRERIPVYLAAVGPKNLELAGEIADGVLPLFLSAERAGDYLDPLRAGRAKAGLEPGRLRRGADLPGVDRRRPAGLRRPGPGVRGALRRRHGLPAAELLQPHRPPDGLRGRGPPGPGPLPGPQAAGGGRRGAVRVHRPHLAARPAGADRRPAGRACAAVGVTTVNVSPYGQTVEDRVESLRVLVGAVERAGLA